MSKPDDSAEPGAARSLIAEYVLGLLDTPTHARLERMIAADPRLQAERDFWMTRLAPLDEEFAEAAPPAHIMRDLDRRLFGSSRSDGLWNSLLLWRAMTAGALATAALAIGFATTAPRQDVTSLTNQLIAALEAEGSDVRFLAFYDGAGTLRLSALSGSTGPDQDLELWAIQDDTVTSMGVVPVGEAIEVPMAPDILAGWGVGSVLALTLEPRGGSPTGIATGPIVAQGAVTRI